ncbi:MAG: aminoacetone oxidase family FAD-binding enzyme, partial [Oscillospiraceae bacterium]|nr:aminoacetone oxidase family FAD-binding enzyme [Oscillospiraceae bacterium]
MNEYFLVIIGGGASGLASAVTACSMSVKKIAILERLPRVGKKILATGNGRCNLSHENISPENYFGSYDTSHVLANFGKAENFFENLGLYCRTDEQGRIYPYSMTANAVLDALRMHCRQVTEICNTCVIELYQKNHKWHILTENQEHMIAKNIIFSAGGTVATKFGTDGTAWDMLRKLQIPIVESKPILCPLRSNKNNLQILKGIRVKGSVTLLEKNKILRTETGEIQFTEQAISGICVFNLASLISKEKLTDYEIAINLFPELENSELIARLYSCQAVRYDSDCENMLSG